MENRFTKYLKHFLLPLVILFMMPFTAKSQIGINTLAPDTSAALDIMPKGGLAKGILIPRTSEAKRLAMGYAGKGLMVYDTTSNMFYMNLTAGSPTWYAINPWVTGATNGASANMNTHSSVNNVGIGVPVPAARLDVNGSIKSNSVVATQTLTANTAAITTSLTVTGFASNALVPTGLISMFSGTLVPAGWGLCDGTVQGGIQTPDLRGRFVIGFDTYSPPPLDIPTGRALVLPSPTALATPTVAPNDGITKNYGKLGNTGGETGHTLSAAESGLPVHSHTSPPHGHGSAGAVYASGPGPTDVFALGNAECCQNASTPPLPDATVTINSSTSQNAANAHENRPPYYVLAYIIKLP